MKRISVNTEAFLRGILTRLPVNHHKPGIIKLFYYVTIFLSRSYLSEYLNEFNFERHACCIKKTGNLHCVLISGRLTSEVRDPPPHKKFMQTGRDHALI